MSSRGRDGGDPERRERSQSVRVKAATRIADVLPDRLKELSEGRAEATTLAEWLAADTATLVRHVLPEVGLPSAAARLLEQRETLSATGVKRKLELIGQVVSEELASADEPSLVVQRLIDHRSNYAREWLAFAIARRRPRRTPHPHLRAITMTSLSRAGTRTATMARAGAGRRMI